MKKVRKIFLILCLTLLCCAAAFWITIETNPEIAAKLGYASGPGKPIDASDTAPNTPNATIPSILYEGDLYATTGRQMPAEVHESAIVGHIRSVVPLSQLPSYEGEANFGQVGDPYALTADGLLVLLHNEWTLFQRLTVE